MSTAQDELNRPEEPGSSQSPSRPSRGSRRTMLTGGLGVAAAVAGASALLELSSETAQASSVKAGDFASSVAGTPAVTASGTNGADGVHATSDSGNGINAIGSSTGVYGASRSGVGVHGQSDSGLGGLFDGSVQVNSNFSASGTKAFFQAHPTDPSKEIVYIALEGGEAGTYVRGTGQLQSGKAVIALPEHFGLVTASEGLTVQLTPRSEWLQLYVVELDTAQLVVREAQGKSGTFDYCIYGVRRGYEQHEVIRTKR